jgi:hypothetical protein
MASRHWRALWVFGAVAAVAIASGCGGSPASAAGDTSVVLLSSSAANDRLVQFGLGFTSLTLASQSGHTVSLLAAPQSAEFIHVNGTAEPLATVIVPQDVYTSASATIGVSTFGCAYLDPTTGGISSSTFGYGATPSSQVSVDLPAPITIAGDAMGITLDLLVSQSAAFSTCVSDGGIEPYSINPTFNLTPVTISPQPTSVTNGRLTGLTGLIAQVDGTGGGFVVTWSDGPKWSVKTDSSTVFQGVGGVAGLIAGTLVDMDVAMQLDSSLLATRVEVEDASATDLSVWNGPIEFVDTVTPAMNSGARQEYGGLFSSASILGGAVFSFGNAAFQISGQLGNPRSLPFSANFTSANMVAGQNVNITTHALSLDSAYPNYLPATTVTLIPQTIDGTVSAVSSSGGFTVYTVALAAYDLFPTLAVQQGQTTLLTNPETVMVYVGSSTQLLSSEAIGVGSVLRFDGLVFNDNGTLRMDCAQVDDGVPE